MEYCGSRDLPNHEEYDLKVEAGYLVYQHSRSYFLGTNLTVHPDVVLYVVRPWRKGVSD
jgi:hypothetical protein